MKSRNRSGSHARLLAMLLGIPLLAGCSPDSAQVNGAGSPPARNNHLPSVRSARIVPVPPVLSEPVSVQVEGEDLDRDPLTFRYQWLVNGEPLPGAIGHQLSPDTLKRGDRVSVEVIPFDGKGQGAPYRTEPVIVGNTLPVVSRVTIEPGQIRVGDVLQAQVEGTDADHDEVRYRFRWWKNNRLVSEGEENTFDTAGFLRDDVVAVSVIPRDGGGEGKEVFSPTMTIANSPPKITSVPHSIIQQGHYLYTVTAVDPEGDPVSFSLPTAPPGMTIDQKTGRVDWRIPPESKGSYRVKVVVQDDRGGWAFQEFDLSLSAPASS
ncbi:MAG: cadherin repeat domain-containing protein [Nitrospirota bacterium]